ncbi:MAG: NYN domain-containing protein [bacterium]|nr:NYN domain-containing protein [bacterium]
MVPNRSIIYIDGFNLYYGAIKDGPHKWLNLERYFQLLRPVDDIQIVYYFTAIIDGPRRVNQLTFLKALETLPLVHVVLGKFKKKKVRCGVGGCAYAGNRVFSIQEEKRTDVNIALQLFDDAREDRCDRSIIVSGDSDLVPAANLVKGSFPGKKIIVYVPARDPIRGAAVELRAAADKDKTLPVNLLKHAQFPPRVPDGAGGFIEKPTDW